ncbi:MAG: tetratricopeptide repeat protein [Planctomycetes bacterium]|nr:tetratricopeptide repeat protein [Planctomycetota bacterium]
MVRFAAAAVMAAILLAGGCGPRRADRAAFDAGYAAFEAGRWQEAADNFTRYLQSDPTSATRGEVYYYRGQAVLHLKQREDARRDFERAIGAEARPPIDQFARVAIGNLYYEEGNDAKALEHYVVVVRKPAKDLPMPMVLLRMGVSLQRLGRWPMADKYLSYLIEKHPDTPAAAEAMRRVHADAFRIQTGAFGSHAAAQIEANRVQSVGMVARIARVAANGRTLYAVQVGRARTYAEAEQQAERVRRAGFGALVVP